MPPSTFTNGWARGHREWKNSERVTDQTVLTITKALTKTTNFTFRAKKSGGHDQQNFFPALCTGPVTPTLPHFHAGQVPSPIFKFTPALLDTSATVQLQSRFRVLRSLSLAGHITASNSYTVSSPCVLLQCHIPSKRQTGKETCPFVCLFVHCVCQGVHPMGGSRGDAS